MRKILFDAFIIVIIVLTIVFLYRTYSDPVIDYFFVDEQGTLYLESTPVSVTIADSLEEQQRGLSHVVSLGEFEGKLFVFDEPDYYAMWMKDMLIPIDIVWIDESFTVVHIEKNVKPDTYPETFAPPVPARFVLEVNAFFTENANIEVGDSVTLPSRAMPWDLIKILR